MNKNKEYMTGKEIDDYFKELNLRTPLGFVLEYAKVYSVKEMLYKAVALNEDHSIFNKPKINKAKRGRPFGYEVTEETRKKIGAANKGKVRSQELKKHLSDIQKGRKRSKEVYARQLEWMKGHKVSEEEKRKLKLNQPHRKTIYCYELDLYFTSTIETSRFLKGHRDAASNVGRAAKLCVMYKQLHFEHIKHNNIPEEKIWKSDDHKDWTPYLNIRESRKDFKHE